VTAIKAAIFSKQVFENNSMEAIAALAALVACIAAAQPAGEARDKARKALERLEDKYEALEKKNTSGAAAIRKKIKEARTAFNNAQFDLCAGVLKGLPDGS
jgi:hypothetical protein